MVVPATAGSSGDILGRVLADGFSSQLGKPFIVVDKPGANGVLGTADVARANPDGYTLMHGATYSITVQPLTIRTPAIRPSRSRRSARPSKTTR